MNDISKHSGERTAAPEKLGTAAGLAQWNKEETVMNLQMRIKRVSTKEKKRPARKIGKASRFPEKGITPINSRSARKAIALVKLVGITMRLKEYNNHLQGLYAELGKIVYEQRISRRTRTGCIRSAGVDGLGDKITEMRKKMDRMEQEASRLRRAA